MSFIAAIKSKISEYADAYLSLLKLNVIGKTAGLVSYLMFFLIGLFFVFTITILLGFGITEAFIALGLSKVASFFCTIGIYFLFLFILFGLRKSITRYFSGVIIRIMTEGDDEEVA